MTSRHALIVDDSRTAQHLLKRMLEQYDLAIDTALSAEEALSYLSHRHPAVIFLDQHMEGMNGIDALKTIKANPHTALIPVIMYTAQADDLFVSQAFALGARDIFSKSSMLPANLERVLRNLNIGLLQERRIDRRRDADNAAADGAPDTRHALPTTSAAAMPHAAAAEPDAAHLLDQVGEQIGRLLDLHRTEVRDQINSSTQAIVRRLASSAAKPPPAADAELDDNVATAIRSAVADVVTKERRGNAIALSVLTVVLTLGIGLLSYVLMQTQGDLDRLARNADVTLQVRKQDTAAVKPVLLSTSNMQDNAAERQGALLRAVGWLQNADFQFDYGEQPLNAVQLANLNMLVTLLAQASYKGPVVIDIHFGNVCLEPNDKPGDSNPWRLARSDLPVASCKMLSSLNPRFAAGDFVTVAYRNLERTLPPVQDGRIALRLASSGLNTPRVDYPMIRSTTTAGEWNRAALRNNRIAVQLAAQ